MRELVIVIQDLYLPEGSAAGATAALPPGLGFLARFGTRNVLAHGWRAWLAAWAGRADLAAVAPARIAAAVHPQLCASPHPLWIAVPVHLSAGLSRVHLDRRGLLRLNADELAGLAREFARAFAGSGFSLTPASARELLLLTPGVEAVEVPEPARCAGGEVNEALPRGPAAAGLRRTWTEIEMWLHALPSNQARAVPLTALWPWGAGAAVALPAAAPAVDGAVAFATDAYVRGLWHIGGLACQAMPATLAGALGTAGARAVMVVEAGDETMDPQGDFAAGLGAIDERYLAPAVRALREGAIDHLVLIASDRSLTVGRRSAWRFWRRPQGLGVLS